MIKKFKAKIKGHFESVWKIKTSPFSLASGFGIGTFLAMMPFSFIGLFIGLGIILVFKKVSKVTLLLAFAIFNPLIELSLQALSYMIGLHILAGKEISPFSIEVYNQLFIYTQRVFIGSFVVGGTLGILGFVVFYYIAKSREVKLANEAQ